MYKAQQEQAQQQQGFTDLTKHLLKRVGKTRPSTYTGNTFRDALTFNIYVLIEFLVLLLSRISIVAFFLKKIIFSLLILYKDVQVRVILFL